ncbi:hypothetical protein SAMN05428982_1601 [Pseudoxanthomonas sp. CF385]|uniref:hypothetical protein n=1 Tax=Pseudoxanthomonas sp. CF385 TaxID=1881042 RepID=UPI00088FA617|nr:hypothetical protein [Pseudoxanthomonas sp. CF385]SDQ56309.1 hypothetical protein SAMN05428982_1601 [Pseudoxanthomonas sp. CF385]
MPIASLMLALLLGASPAAATPDTATLSGLLEVHERDGGCSGDANTDLRVQVDGTRTTFEQDVWLSVRESLDPMDILEITREGTALTATVNVHVAPIEPGRPVPACIRPVNVRLHIDGLPPGDYTLQLKRAES